MCFSSINYTFPKTVFADTYTSSEQVDYVLSEMDEVNRARVSETHRRTDEELLDLLHSIETYFRIRCAEAGERYVREMVEQVRVKNSKRGYYGKTEGGKNV